MSVVPVLSALARLPLDHARNALKGMFGPRHVAERRVVQAVVLSERGVLLALRSELMGWELPGGNLAAGESDEAALVREVREETGLEIALDATVGEYRRTGFFAHRALVFRARAIGGALAPSRETPASRGSRRARSRASSSRGFARRSKTRCAAADAGRRVKSTTARERSPRALRSISAMRWRGGLPETQARARSCDRTPSAKTRTATPATAIAGGRHGLAAGFTQPRASTELGTRVAQAARFPLAWPSCATLRGTRRAARRRRG